MVLGAVVLGAGAGCAAVDGEVRRGHARAAILPADVACLDRPPSRAGDLNIGQRRDEWMSGRDRGR
jgi:hypothetical protein